MFNVYLLVLMLFYGMIKGQRVAPGVPPQHYQQPHQQQQFQQPQYHHQQPHVQPVVQHVQPAQHAQPVQHVQQPNPPMQQQQNQPHFQQNVPSHQNHAPHQGHGGHHPQQVLNAANIQNERAHIQEHMEVPIDTSQMSEAELQFHYFKMHDSDNNNKLDGCELIKSLIHWHEGGHDSPKEEIVRTDTQLSELIDPLMNLMDLNKDGFISWEEYRESEKSQNSN